jgi:hypothetical protein
MTCALPVSVLIPPSNPPCSINDILDKRSCRSMPAKPLIPGAYSFSPDDLLTCAPPVPFSKVPPVWGVETPRFLSRHLPPRLSPLPPPPCPPPSTLPSPYLVCGVDAKPYKLRTFLLHSTNCLFLDNFRSSPSYPSHCNKLFIDGTARLRLNQTSEAHQNHYDIP